MPKINGFTKKYFRKPVAFGYILRLIILAEMKNFERFLRENRFFRFWFPVIIYSGIIFYVSSIPRLQIPLGNLNFDKVVHVIEYLPFGFLLARAVLITSDGLSFKRALTIVLLLSFLYGLSDEFHQYFVKGRNSSFFDVVADSIGGTIGCLLYYKFLYKYKRK